ncbi:hypothetical protein BIW11_10149 [Tropilaelaps mercedesae]|uniref:Uncharacterized protein n=1 Tax=Tropilaelaps mercedesae TaxID=418985 RepID=A0A1V9XH02_9ACAR|nr:hypothetical protein BIW11_10149 [Tropilaelaps mercedesae]
MTSSCWHTFPVPVNQNSLTILRGPADAIYNFALSATLHCIKDLRFCYYIADANDSALTRLTPFDSCSFSVEFASLLVPMHACTADTVLEKIKHIGRPNNVQRPTLVVVRIPCGSLYHGVVNIIGYLQDVQTRTKSSCVLLQDHRDKPLPVNVLRFYSVKVYETSQWRLKQNGEDVYVHETPCHTEKA